MFVYLNNKAGLRALGHHGHPGIVGRVGAHPGGSGARGPDGPYHPFPVQISSAALFTDFQTLMKIIKKTSFSLLFIAKQYQISAATTCIRFFMPVLSTRDRLLTGASSLLDLRTKPPRSSALSLAPGPPGPEPLLMAELGLGSSTPGWSEDTEGLRAPSPPLECDAIPKAALVLTP